MKKLLYVFCCLSIVFAVVAVSLTGCKTKTYSEGELSLGDQFNRICKHTSSDLSEATYLYHVETEVVYVYIHNGNQGGLTVLYTAEGTPAVTKDTFALYHTHDGE